MYRMYAINSHSYTHLILALGIVREPTVWVFITSQYPGIHDLARLLTAGSIGRRVRPRPLGVTLAPTRRRRHPRKTGEQALPALSPR